MTIDRPTTVPPCWAESLLRLLLPPKDRESVSGDLLEEYRDSVLPPAVTARVAVEQASTFGWERYVGTTGRVVGMHTFGASAPLKALQAHYGFEPDRVVAVAKEVLGRK